MTTFNKFQIHYFLNNGLHEMDAFVKNKCEAELLAIAREIIILLEIDASINVEALQEGGVKELWSFLGKNGTQITVICSIFTLIIAVLSLPDSELNTLQKENFRLQNEQIRRDLNKENIDIKEIDSRAEHLSKNQKIITRRSNFYKILDKETNVTDVGFIVLDDNKNPIGKEVIVQKAYFRSFVQTNNKLPTETDDEAVIEIVAPVLRGGKRKWMGVYNGELISFFMEDSLYVKSVHGREISFTRGNAIVCILKTYREINDLGDDVVVRRSVQTVLKSVDDGVFTDTLAGRQYRHRKLFMKRQMDLFQE